MTERVYREQVRKDIQRARSGDYSIEEEGLTTEYAIARLLDMRDEQGGGNVDPEAIGMRLWEESNPLPEDQLWHILGEWAILREEEARRYGIIE
jgi:hypothetical protein